MLTKINSEEDIMKYFVIYNPISGNGRAEELARGLGEKLEGGIAGFADMTKITNYSAFLSDKTDCDLIICGGDGTLNRFVNDTEGIEFGRDIYFYAAGTGNDFLRDIGCELGELVKVTDYVKDLPVCEVKGKSYRFINGVGYGIDGYCCEIGDKMRAEGKTDINYTGIAIKGLLFAFKPRSATVCVDGVTKKYKKVWIAPTMNGRFYGGGMMPTPAQKRKGGDGRVSLMVFHRSGKLRTLMIFPSLFKGEHLKHSKYIELVEGNEISVEFDSPTPLQIDGETHLGVMGYKVRSAAAVKEKSAEEAALAHQSPNRV